MLNFATRRPDYLSISLSEYCNRITNESIRKLTEKMNLERNKPKIKNAFKDDDNSGKPEIKFFNYLLFLSVATMAIYFYKRIK